MPCSVSDSEKAYYEARTLLEYIEEKTGQSRPFFDSDGNSIREPTQELCATLRGMDPEKRDALIYQPRDRMARHLANWWEDHQEKDAEDA